MCHCQLIFQWNLICDRSHLAAIIQSMYFVGMLVGSFVSGILSDTFGRKLVLFVSVAGMSACGVAQSFVQTSIPVFALLRFGTGFFLVSASLTQFVYMLEVIGPGYRARMGNINNWFYIIGSFTRNLIAYFITDWRTFSWLSSIFPLPIFFFWWVLPESARWLVVKGKLERAHQTVMKYGGIDNKPCESDHVMTLLKSIHDDQVRRTSTAKRYTPLDLVRTSKLRRWTIITSFTWFTTAFVYYAIMIYASQLHGNVYVILTVIPALGGVFVLPAWYSMNRLGRRLTQVIFMFLVGVVLLLVIPIPKDYAVVITYLAIFGQIIVIQEWSCVYLISTELFPTVLRSTAQGLGSTAARIGGIVAPYLLILAQLPGLSIILPMTIFGACAIACGIASLWLPETALRPLYQTTVEAEENPEDYGIPFLRKRQNTRAMVGETSRQDTML